MRAIIIANEPERDWAISGGNSILLACNVKKLTLLYFLYRMLPKLLEAKRGSDSDLRIIGQESTFSKILARNSEVIDVRNPSVKTIQPISNYQPKQESNVSTSENDGMIMNWTRKSLSTAFKYIGQIVKTTLVAVDTLSNLAEPIAVPLTNAIPNPVDYLPKRDIYVSENHCGLQNDSSDDQVHFISDVRDRVVSAVDAMANFIPYSEKILKSARYASPGPRVGVSDKNLSEFHVYSSGMISEQFTISFPNADWLVFYQLGVAQSFKDTIQPDILRQCKFVGSSTGVLVALALALGLDLDLIREGLLEIALDYSKRSMGPTLALTSVLKPLLEKWVKSDISLSQARLLVSLTEIPSLCHVLKSSFTNKKDLIDTILASCSLTNYTESNNFGGIYTSGCLSEGIPMPSLLTITVSPLQDKANVSPKVSVYSRYQQMVPSSNESMYAAMVEDGWKDGRKWLMTRLKKGILPSSMFA